jgi:hypothetical protein
VVKTVAFVACVVGGEMAWGVGAVVVRVAVRVTFSASLIGRERSFVFAFNPSVVHRNKLGGWVGTV